MEKARAILTLIFPVLTAGCSTAQYSERTIYVSPQLVSSRTGNNQLQSKTIAIQYCSVDCLEIRDVPQGMPSLIFNSIKGFKFEAGNSYKLKVQILTENQTNSFGTQPVENWTLLETLEKTPIK
jgi:Domain of unknown function (DUF4377)